jgi:hypothetical protein
MLMRESESQSESLSESQNRMLNSECELDVVFFFFACRLHYK